MGIKLSFHANLWRPTSVLRFHFWWAQAESLQSLGLLSWLHRKESSHWGSGNCPTEKPVQKDDLLQLDKFEDPDTSLTALETEVFKNSLSNGVSESCLTLLSPWAPGLVRESKGAVQICFPVQSLGCHPRPTARMPMVVEVCVMWCTLSAAPKLSMLSLFSCILGNSKGFF